MGDRQQTSEEPKEGGDHTTKPTNEHVLNIAFFSFVAFVLVQSVFAIIAHSQSMLADSEAMFVDALTYLFNLLAERLKHRPPTKEELRFTPAVRAYKLELRRLNLELFPPLVSVATLLVITIMTMREAFETLRTTKSARIAAGKDDVSIIIMLFFSGTNLLLDIVNVTCFARAQSAFGLNAVRQDHVTMRESITSLFSRTQQRNEIMQLLQHANEHGHDEDDDHEIGNNNNNNSNNYVDSPPVEEVQVPIHSPSQQQQQQHNYGSTDAPPSARSSLIPLFGPTRDDIADTGLVNLNMCSAWTHVCADTLRSIAVLVAASVATIFPAIDGTVADAVAAVAVSVIILVSLFPLIQGLIITAVKIQRLRLYPVTN